MIIGANKFKELNPKLVELLKELDNRWAKAKNIESIETQNVSPDAVKIGLWSAQNSSDIAKLKFKGLLTAFLSGKKELSFDEESGILTYSQVEKEATIAQKPIEKIVYKEKELSLDNILAFIPNADTDACAQIQSAITKRKKELK